MTVWDFILRPVTTISLLFVGALTIFVVVGTVYLIFRKIIRMFKK